MPICFEPLAVGACDPLPRPWRKFKDSCYFFADGTGGTNDTLTWREARESCRQHGADLASIDTGEENRFLQGMVSFLLNMLLKLPLSTLALISQSPIHFFLVVLCYFLHSSPSSMPDRNGELQLVFINGGFRNLLKYS